MRSRASPVIGRAYSRRHPALLPWRVHAVAPDLSGAPGAPREDEEYCESKKIPYNVNKGGDPIQYNIENFKGLFKEDKKDKKDKKSD